VLTGLETGSEILFVDPDLGERPHVPDQLPDSYSLRHIGLDKYVEAYRVYPQARSEAIAEHASGIAWKLQGTNPLDKVLVVLSLNLLDPVLDAMEEPQPEPRRRRREAELLNPHPDCLAEITTEYPYLQHLYEESRGQADGAEPIDRRRAQLDVLRDAEAALSVNAGETVEHWQRRLIARYTRNLALANGDLTAALFDLTVAARSIVGDNYAWEVWQAAGRYPPQKEESDIETVNLSGEEIWRNTRKIRLRRRLPRPKQRLRPAGLKRRKKERFAGEWAHEFHGQAICSYPPEDMVIEDYGRFLKKKARAF
jgi:hypothetical protein